MKADPGLHFKVGNMVIIDVLVCHRMKKGDGNRVVLDRCA